MSYIFEIKNKKAYPTEEVLLIEPFKTIWERDKTEDKEEAIKEFTFIEFFASKKKTNPYKGYKPEVREYKLKEMLWKNPNHKLDKLVWDGIKLLEEFQTQASPIYRFYEASVTAAEKTIDFFNSFSYEERDKSGKLLYQPNVILNTLEKASKVMQALKDMKDKVEQELLKETKIRGGKEINPFEV